MTEEDSVKSLMARRQLLEIEKERLATSKALAERKTQIKTDFLAELFSQQAPSKGKTHAGFMIRAHLKEYFPDFKIAKAWANWFSSEVASQFPHASEGPRIAFTVGGGVGDALKASSLFQGLQRQFGGKLYVFTNTPAFREILKNHPYCQDVIVLKKNVNDFTRDTLRYVPLFDLVVHWRYAAFYYFPTGSAFSVTRHGEVAEKNAAENRPYHKYNFVSDVWPVFNNLLSREARKRDLNVLGISERTSALGFRDQPVIFALSPASASFGDLHKDRPYITVHDGFDPNHKHKRTARTDYTATKNLPRDIWNRILAGIKDLGLDVVQLGITGEAALPGADHVYNGLTSFSETAMLIKNAVCHVDTEGGLVHLARAVHTPSVVMFGPTPKDFFGYRQNVNLEPKTCKDCWYTTTNWVVQCPRLTSGPQCMREHDPADVVSAVKDIWDRKRVETFDLVEDLPERGAGSVAEICAGLPQTARALWVGEAAPAAPLAAHFDDLQIIDTDLQSDPRASTDVIKASPLNLPIDSESMDAVLTPIMDWHLSKPAILREMARVLKPGGSLFVLGAPSQDGTLTGSVGALLDEAGLTFRRDGTGTIGKGFRLVKRQQGVPAPRLRDTQTPTPGNAIAANPWFSRISEQIENLEKDNANTLEEIEQILIRRDQIEDRIWEQQTKLAEAAGRPGNKWISYSGLENFLVEGWHKPENWGVWGKGTRHSLSLALEKPTTGGLEVEVLFNLPKGKKNIRRIVEVHAGRKKIGTMEHRKNSARGQFHVPQDCLVADRAALVTFVLDEFYIPALAEPGSTDQRALGLGLLRLRYRPA